MRGVEVLQALVEGKRVRLLADPFYELPQDRWIRGGIEHDF